MTRKILLLLLAIAVISTACNLTKTLEPVKNTKADTNFDKYTPFKLTADLSKLTDKQKEMLPILMEVLPAQ